MKSSLVMLLLVAAVGNQASGLTLQVLAESSVYDPLTNRVDFTISFNRVPDLFTADGAGRQADAFQYWVFYNNKPFQVPANPELDALIRGGEIYVNGNLPIRAARPPAVGDPQYGGWGEIRTAVPLILVSTTLSFSTDLANLGDDDGVFAYRLDAYEFGDTCHSVFGGTAGPYKNIPEPGSLLLATAASLVFMTRRMRILRVRGPGQRPISRRDLPSDRR